MPRVLIAHPSPDVYGSDLQLVESITGLRDAGWDVTLVLPGRGPLVERVGTDAEVVIQPFPVLRKALLRPLPFLLLVLNSPRELLRLVRLIRSARPDVVYVNTVTIPLWIAAARVARRPVVTHVHEAEADAPRVVRTALNAPMLLASAVVCNSRASEQVLLSAVPRLGRITRVVPNGVPDPGATPYAAARKGHVALVGRLSPRKGTDVALDAIGELRREGRDVRLEVCGTAYEGYEWFADDLRQRAARSDLAGSVTFSGYVNPTAPVLSAASIVLVPSRVEPFGNTAVEGLFSGRPVVVSDTQGLTEIITDGVTGVRVPPGDAPALARAVAALLDDPDRAERLGEAGRAEALDRFTVDRYRRDMVAVVAGLAGRR